MANSHNVTRRLIRCALLSSLWLLLAVPGLRAHEVTPAIGDLHVAEGRLVLDLRLNLEALMADLDLDVLVDTSEAADPAAYETYRAMDSSALAPEARIWAEGWLQRLTIQAGDDGRGMSQVPLSVAEIRIPAVGDPDQTRFSHLVVTGPVPATADALTLTWPARAGDLALRQQGVEAPYTGLLAGGETTPPIPLAGGAARSGWQVFGDYIPVGFDHILPKGLDHILFVLGLFFLSPRLRPLLWQISAFTLAHTLTLALGATGLVSVPARIVEPLIAASIVFVAVENLLTDGLKPWRTVVIFGFGLLHGLGFASVLGEFGLPPGQFVPAPPSATTGTSIISDHQANRSSSATASPLMALAVIGLKAT
jgi:hypothetical protein